MVTIISTHGSDFIAVGQYAQPQRWSGKPIGSAFSHQRLYPGDPGEGGPVNRRGYDSSHASGFRGLQLY